MMKTGDFNAAPAKEDWGGEGEKAGVEYYLRFEIFSFQTESRTGQLMVRPLPLSPLVELLPLLLLRLVIRYELSTK